MDIKSFVKEHKLLILIFFLALFIRSAGLYGYSQNPKVAADDTFAHQLMAHNLLVGKGFAVLDDSYSHLYNKMKDNNRHYDFADFKEQKSTYQANFVSDMPGYSILLALTWFVAGQERLIYLQIIQIILSACMIFLIYYIAKSFFNRQIALLTCFLYSFFFYEIYEAIIPFRDIFPYYLTVFVVFLLVLMHQNKLSKINTYLLLGLGIGLCVWLRSTVALFPIFISLWIIWSDGIKEGIKSLCIMIAVMLLLMSPWIVRNYNTFNEIIPFSTNSGHGLFVGFGDHPNPWGIKFDDTEGLRWLKEKGYTDVNYLSQQYDSLLKKESINLIFANPVWYVSTVLIRIVEGFFIGVNPFITNTTWSIIIKLASIVMTVIAAAGIYLKRKDLLADLKKYAILFIPLIALIFSYAPFQMNSRFILPAAWVYFIFISITSIYLYDKFIASKIKFNLPSIFK